MSRLPSGETDREQMRDSKLQKYASERVDVDKAAALKDVEIDDDSI